MKRLLFSLLFIACWSNNHASINSMEQISPALLKANEEQNEQQVQLELSKLSKQQSKEISALLLILLDDVLNRLSYWQLQKLQPLSYFVTRGPFKWFSSKPQWKEIQEHCQFLQQEADYLSYYLGAINEQKSKSTKSINTPKSKEEFYKLLSFINQPLTQTTQVAFPTSDTMAWSDLIWLCQNNEEHLDDFYSEYQQKISHHGIPNHFHRHWVRYSLLGAGALAVGYLTLKNPKEMQNRIASKYETAKSFCLDHIVKPIKNGYEKLFTSFELISDEVLTAQEEQIEARFKSIIKKELSISDEELNQEARKMLADGYSSRIDKMITAHQENSIINLGRKPLLAEWILHFFDLKLSLGISRIQSQIQDMANSWRPLDAFVTLLSGSMFAILGGTGTVLLYSKIKSDPHENIKTIVHTIHRTINIKRQQEELKNIDNGLVQYWIWKLKGLAEHVKLSSRSAFLQDLKLLESFSTSREQKLTAIEQMYRRYTFLKMY